MTSRHGSELEKRLEEHKTALTESLARGLENNMYWRTVGQIQGIADAIALSQETDKDLSGG